MDLPTLEQTSNGFRDLVVDKAHGEDCISPNVPKMVSESRGRLYHPVIAKASLLATEPLQWRVGNQCELYKGKGPQHSCASFRDILVSDIIGKSCHKFHRTQIYDTYLEYSHEAQCCAVSHGGTDTASHLVRSAFGFASLLNLCIAVIYIDLVKTFDFIIREFALGWIGLDKVTKKERLQSLGLSPQSATHFAGIN